MTPAEILALYDSRVVYAHGAHDALGGSMHPSNLWPTRRSEDAPQTRKDIGSIAKTKRQRRRQATHDAAIARKSGQAIDLAMIPVDVRGHMADMPARDERRAWPSRSFPKRPKTKWSKRPFPKRRRGR